MNRLLLIVAVLACGAFSYADDCSDCNCARCGCQSHCHPVYKVICEMKDVKHTCYCCKTNEICIPGRSCKCGEVDEGKICCMAHPSQCDCCEGCEHHHGFLDSLCAERYQDYIRTVWQPSCEVKTRDVTKLIKYEVVTKEPHYKWVVEYCCDGCCNTEVQHGAQMTPPAEEEKLVDGDKPGSMEKLSVISSGAQLEPLPPYGTGSAGISILKKMEQESQGAPAGSNNSNASTPAPSTNRFGWFK